MMNMMMKEEVKEQHQQHQLQKQQQEQQQQKRTKKKTDWVFQRFFFTASLSCAMLLYKNMTVKVYYS